ncbi:class I SAM-dependent DNA methyltransferase [Nocardia sp. NPDC057353]|uniref:class I SAM-dependent DNA methyltransferase n=1 Tax=Nocardia sp. NPDC057353 TaxID=3346104 RepID=UPI0036368B89
MIDHFGEAVAATYDRNSAERFEPELVASTVDVLAELAGAGRALELGIGTGRIALPLAARGVPVHGIELSTAMLARLRAKPGGAEIGVTVGDFASTRVAGEFALAYLVFNTIMNLTTQDAQVACFRAVADQLTPGGCFAVEVIVPELRKLPAGQTVLPFGLGPDRWARSDYNPATQAAPATTWTSRRARTGASRSISPCRRRIRYAEQAISVSSVHSQGRRQRAPRGPSC